MGNLKDSLSKKLNQLGISRQVEAVGVVEAAQNEISKHVPAEDFEVISFKSGKLKITTRSSAAANEIVLVEAKLKKALPQIQKINISSTGSNYSE